MRGGALNVGFQKTILFFFFFFHIRLFHPSNFFLSGKGQIYTARILVFFRIWRRVVRWVVPVPDVSYEPNAFTLKDEPGRRDPWGTPLWWPQISQVHVTLQHARQTYEGKGVTCLSIGYCDTSRELLNMGRLHTCALTGGTPQMFLYRSKWILVLPK
jgi:hypothetical protein